MMSSTISSRKNQYAAHHHRRPSSQSQSSLPDQIKSSRPQIQSPNRSLVFLPSTAYSAHSQSVSRAPTTAGTTEQMRMEPNNSSNFEDSPVDPRDFYRPYQGSFGDASPKGFHQDALRTSGLDDGPPQSRTRKSSAASVQSQEGRGLRSPRSSASGRQLSIVTNSLSGATHGGSAPPKTLASRKASFKDLVARFDASPDDVPPMPSHPGSLPNSTKNSPVVFSNPNHMATPSATKSSVDLHNSQRNDSILKMQKSQISQQESSRRQRPLFGEVLSGGGAPGTAGYGIVNARRRRGSEGSPMHSPNAMFPASSRATLEPLPVEPTQHRNHTSPRRTNASTTPTYHRRANSDFSSASTVSRIPISTVNSIESPITDPNRFRANRTSGSKIPLSTRRQSLTSESGPSNPSSRTTSKLENYPPAGQGTRATPTSAHGQRSQPGHKHRRPAQIQSPGKKGRNITIPQGEKSPSLRANIIAPPPKISPPLRGSRQRLPVSSATTAASRARMAEKFQAMAREQIDKKSTSRITRPPELTDIDFNARRLKITQALSRSREEQDMRGQILHGKRETKSRSHSVVTPDHNLEDRFEGQAGSPDIPALVVQSPNVDDDGDVFRTPTEDSLQHESAFTQSALLALDTQHSYFETDDSPTLGQADEDSYSKSPEESQDESKQNHLLEPASAVTETTMGTLNTPIDNESQVNDSPTNDPKFSLLTQVTSMRDRDASTPLSGVSPSDRADAESVHLFLRNTTYDMDEDEAVAKGYRGFLADPPVPKIPDSGDVHRSSWTSSIAEHSEGTANNEPLEHERDSTSEGHRAISGTHQELSSLAHSQHEANDELAEHTAASDAYTIVNIVLQEQSISGVVDQQLVDDIYQRLLMQEPQITESNILDEHRVVEICLRELDECNERGWQSEANDELTYEPQDSTPAQDSQDNRKSVEHDDGTRSVVDEDIPPEAPPKDLFPPPSFRTHKYKSSLDSAEDWADTSPSVGDWMQFALARNSISSNPKEPSPLAQGTVAGQLGEHSTADQSGSEAVDPITRQGSRPSLIASPPPRPPSHSPPPPPNHTMASIDQTSTAIPDPVLVTLPQGPQIPHRMASLSQMSHTKPPSQSTASLEITPTGEVTGEDESPDQRRMKQRKHVLRELVDTEFSYERDLRVLCDIYKQTALTVLTEDDVKVLFGNVDSVQSFAKEFLSTLKQVARPAYVMERQDRRKELTRTPTSTSMSDRASIRTEPDITDAEKDRQTRIGQAFEASMPDMESTYKDYIRGRHLANQRLTQLQSLPGVRQWLNECSQNSTDITNAWSLDALLVKPIQRITKYPLLLNQLLESTSADHPDFGHLRRAFTEVTDINIRINEIKKHTEIVDQVMNRKRKESDVRAGLTKAFGRRAEKLRQHVGINESYEDGEYDRLKIEHDNNTVHLLIVSKDCQGYIDAIRGWVVRMCELAAAAESWLDVGHSNHPEAESKLRQLAMAVRGIDSIALPDHSELVMRKVIQPMEKALVLLERFKSDPKGLLSKREKKILDYNQAKNKKDRGEKLDRKMTERMEQWEAINVEAKQRMRKLRQTSTTLVQSCLANLIQLNMAWVAMIEQKFAAAMAIPIEGLEHMDLIKEWQVDYDFQHAFTMSLGICNGTLLAEAMNLMSFLTPGSTLNGEESPRQSSWNSGAKRSISMNSEGSHLPENGPRYSGQHSSQSDYPEGSSSGQNSARHRATSLASGRTPQTPDLSGRNTGLGSNMPNGHSRPGTSPGRSDEGSMPAPRVSLDAPSPSLGVLRSPSPARPGSASTFFSAAAGPSTYASQPLSGGSSIFSSAMPMSDSPETERHPGVGFGDEEPEVLFTAASIYEFNIDRARQEGGIPYLTYVGGEIFDVIGARGELWLARNQDDANRQVGWIWNKHFAKLAT